MSKWYLISKEDTAKIQNGLARMKESCHEGSFAGILVEDIRHTLTTGLHTTEAVPEDFKND